MWIIPFADLNDNSYEIRVDDGDSNQYTLKGAAVPIVTQEDDDENMFKPVRNQTGYIRIVDDASMMNGTMEEQFNWIDLLPTTSVNRPVQLYNTGDDLIMWMGFLAPETFNGDYNLYPQEREFPIVDMLSVLEGYDMEIGLQYGSIIPLGGLLYLIFYDGTHSTFNNIDYFYFQGVDATDNWLLQGVSTSLLYDVGDDGNREPRYNHLQLLQNICQFLGLTCRMWGTSVWFVAPSMDIATASPNFSRITKQDLSDYLNGHGQSVQPASVNFTSQSLSNFLSSHPFMSKKNSEYVVQGVKKVTVEEDVDTIDKLMEFPKDEIKEYGVKTVPSGSNPFPMWGTTITSQRYKDAPAYGIGLASVCELMTNLDGTAYIYKFKDVTLSIPVYGSSNTPIGDLNLKDYDDAAYDNTGMSANLIKRTYNWTPGMTVSPRPVGITMPSFLTLTSNNEISLADGILVLHMETVIDMINYQSPYDHLTWNGYARVWMTISIGGKYWNQTSRAWVSQRTEFAIVVGGTEQKQGNTGKIPDNRVLSGWYPSWNDPNRSGPYPPYSEFGIPVTSRLSGKISISIVDLMVLDTEKIYGTEVSNLPLSFRDISFEFLRGTAFVDWSSRDKNKYVSTNSAPYSNEVHIHNIFTVDNNNAPGNGILFDPDGGYTLGLEYTGVGGGSQIDPGQHLADAIRSFYSSPRRILYLDLGNPIISNLPRYIITNRNKSYYPMSVSVDWRQGSFQTKFIEL